SAASTARSTPSTRRFALFRQRKEPGTCTDRCLPPLTPLCGQRTAYRPLRSGTCRARSAPAEVEGDDPGRLAPEHAAGSRVVHHGETGFAERAAEQVRPVSR